MAATLPFAACALPIAAQTAASPSAIAAVTPSGAAVSSSQSLLAEANPPAGFNSAFGSDGAASPFVAAQDAPAAAKPILPADIYNNGFFVASKAKSFSLYVNGLAQVRATPDLFRTKTSFGLASLRQVPAPSTCIWPVSLSPVRSFNRA